MSIIIDEEFKNLIPPLSPDEFAQLEENCTKEGIRDDLIVWETPNGTKVLIDGHNRFQIAARHGLHWNERVMLFKSRDEAREWIIRNQFGRRNLSAYDRSILALKLKPIIAEKAKGNQVRTAENRVSQKSDEQKVSTKDELAKIAGVSHDTIHKVEAIENKATDRTKQLIREGKLSINQAYNSVHPKQPDPVKVAKEEHEEFEQKKSERVIDFNAVQADKQNKELIDNALMKEVLKLLNDIDKFGMTHKTAELECLSNMVEDDERGIYSNRIESCQLILEKIKNALIRR